MLKRIVIPGMIGRKKDSFLMWLVIVLSIVFSISATILFTSSEHAKYIERIANYGSWPFGVLDTDIDTAKRFENKFGEVVTFHTIGNDPGAGMVAAVEPERLERIGGLRLIEGAMPSQPDEIAFEYARRGYFATGVKVGERNRIELELYRNVIPEHEAVDRLFQVRRGFDAYRVQVEYDDSTLHYFFAKMVPVCETPEEFASLLDRLRDRSPEFSQDVLDTFFDPEFQKTLNHVLSPPDFVFYYQGYSVVDSDTVDGYLIRRYRRWFYKGQALKAEAGETREQLTKRIMEIGLLVEDRVVFYADMLATGVLMDYSKSWDRGEKTLPSALIHPSMEVFVLNAFENAAFNDFTAEELALYRTFGRTSVFASPDQVDLDTLHETAAEFAQTISSPQDLVVNETIYPAIPPQRDVFLMNAVIALIFVATMVCIFQINLAQFKRRTRKLMLFQSIGMTRGQIGQMLGSEVGILLLLAVPTGLVFGLLFAWCAVQVGTRHFGFSLV
ncbi:MAG: ABC transporter permease, partial [Bacillota bacterium]|nr:ABC transporter permease [Bacillota bacterium]